MRPRERSPGPAEHWIRGPGPITGNMPDHAPTEPVLIQVMNMRRAGEYNTPGNAGSRTYLYRACFGQSQDELRDAAEHVSMA
jgi:hypothetical protein